MKKYKNIKRILSLILAVVLFAGTVSAFGYQKAEASQTEYNEVAISFGSHSASDGAFYLTATITDGPNKGQKIHEAYGDWGSASQPELLCDGVAHQVTFSTATDCMHVNAVPRLDTYEKIEVAEGLVLNMLDSSRLKTPIKIKNKLVLEKENGVWKAKADESGDKEDTDQDEVITEVKITGYEMYPKQEDGFCQIIYHTDRNLNAVYPNGGFRGEISVGDTKKTVDFWLGDNLFYTVGVTYDEYVKADKITLPKDSLCQVIANDKAKIKITKGIELVKKSGLWMDASVKVHEYTINDFEIYRIEERNFYQLVLKFTGDIRDTSLLPFRGSVLLDGKAKEIEWYVDPDNGLFYTVGITLEEGDKAKKIEIAKDSFFTIVDDTKNVICMKKALKLVKLDGIWVKDEGQTKIEYNEVKLSYSGCDGKGFYLKAEIVAGPDKGKSIGSKNVYGDWLTSAAGAMTYDKNKTMDVWFSPTGDMIYVSGDYNLAKIKNITFKKGTILTPMAGAQCNTMMKLSNTLELAKDTRYDRWVLAKDVNKKYNFNDVKVGVTRVTGSVLEMKGTFTKNGSKQLMDVYGDWVVLNGAITLGDPAKGKYTEGGASWSLAGDMLMLYGISAGLMDSIQIKAGTVLWPDASCKSQNPIRITNDVVMRRNAEDEWVISKGKYTVSMMNTTTNQTDDSQTSDKAETKKETSETVTEKETTVRLVEKSKDTKELATSYISVERQESQMLIYIAVGIGCAALGVLAILWIVLVKRRKGKGKRKEG